MKKKIGMLLVICVLGLLPAACGGKGNDVIPTPTEAVEVEITLTVAPTATVTLIPEPTVTKAPEPTQAETPMVKDTYEYGVITDIGYASKWCNLRFTSQPGFEFGTQDGLEMYAQCADGARIEIRTDLLPEEYQEMQEVDYLALLVDEMKNGTMNSVEETSVNTYSIGGDEYTAVSTRIEDADGQVTLRDYYLRKKESRMIVITATLPMARRAYKSTENLFRCLGGYDSDPVYLPEEWLACSAFDAGVITENGYENEWLNLRITLPEDATLTKLDSDYIDVIEAAITWETKMPQVLSTITFADGATAEDYLNFFLDYSKETYSTMAEENITFYYEEQLNVAMLGGQEYLVLTMTTSRPEEADRQTELYCRVQDNYIVAFGFMYDADSEETIREFMNLFTTY